jgi:hypothetical protein
VRVVVVLAGLLLSTAALADAGSKPADHVCASNESKATCTIGHVRVCAKDGALAACVCPPGTRDSKGACVDDPAPAVVVCVAPDATIGKALHANLELGTLEVPRLPNVELSDIATATNIKTTSATAEELIHAAEAWESKEGAAAYAANEGPFAKSKSKLAARDQAIDRVIEVRKAFVARFATHARGAEQRVDLARALLRRAAYAGVGKTVEPDRKLARTALEQVVASGSTARPARDAAFMLGEQAVRDREWPLVVAHEERVLKWASAKLNADDHPYLAAASARLAQARLETADLPRAKTALDDAISVGVSCSPRAECVSAATAARRALAATWAATSSPARTMAPILRKGAMPRHERVRPLLQLVELYVKGSGGGCSAAAEEARAWEQVL